MCADRVFWPIAEHAGGSKIYDREYSASYPQSANLKGSILAMVVGSSFVRRIVTGLSVTALMLSAVGCSAAVEQPGADAVSAPGGLEVAASPSAAAENLETAIFAGVASGVWSSLLMRCRV